MSRRRLADGALSFPRYLQRMQVLTMYRQVLRSTYKIEDRDVAAELRSTARAEMERSRNEGDSKLIKDLVKQGYGRLKHMNDMINLSQRE